MVGTLLLILLLGSPCWSYLSTNYFKVNRREIVFSAIDHLKDISDIDKLYFSELLYSEYDAKEPFPFASTICDSLYANMKLQNSKDVSFEFLYKAIFSANFQNCKLNKDLLSVMLESAENHKKYQSFYYCKKLEEISNHKCSLTPLHISAEPTTTSKIFESIHLMNQTDSKTRLDALLSTIPLEFIISGSLTQDITLTGDLLLLYSALLKDSSRYWTDTLQNNLVEFISKRYLHCTEPAISYFRAYLAKLLKEHGVHIPVVTLDMDSLIVNIMSPEESKLVINVNPTTLNPFAQEEELLTGLKNVVLSGLKCGEDSYKLVKEKTFFEFNEDEKSYVLDLGAHFKDNKPKFHMSGCIANINLVMEKSEIIYTKKQFELYFNILTDFVPYKSMSIWIPSRKQKITGLNLTSKLPKELSLYNYETLEIEVQSSSDVYFIFDGPHKVVFKSAVNDMEPNLRTLKLDFNKVDRSDFHFVSGKYDLKVMTYGNNAGPTPEPWIVGVINIQFSESEEKFRTISHSYEGIAKNIIETEIPLTHQGSILFAICGIFAVVAVILVGSVLVANCNISLHKPYQISLPAAFFFLTFSSIFVLYFGFWVQLNMFQTVYIAAPLLMLALGAINYMF